MRKGFSQCQDCPTRVDFRECRGCNCNKLEIAAMLHSRVKRLLTDTVRIAFPAWELDVPKVYPFRCLNFHRLKAHASLKVLFLFDIFI